jgi:hypothetical protein
MWSRLTRGGDGLPREKVDAIVRLIDQYLSEEASLRNLQSDKQTIHPRDLPPGQARGAYRRDLRAPQRRAEVGPGPSAVSGQLFVGVADALLVENVVPPPTL